jgi:hypothetical protein
MLNYVDVKDVVEAFLTAANWKPMPFFDPGPGTDVVVQDKSPDTMVIITLTPGAGLDSEELFDRAGIQIRTIGPQEDYDTAEKLAQIVDRALIAIDHSQNLNGKRVLSVVRAGGAPALMPIDNGDRYHFTCNYIWEVQY